MALRNPFRRPTPEPLLSASLPSTPALLTAPRSAFIPDNTNPTSFRRTRSVSPPLPPRPPPRRQESLEDEPPDDPPPAYSEIPTELEASVDFGPTRPFINNQRPITVVAPPQRQPTLPFNPPTPISPSLPPPPPRANSHQATSSEPTQWRRQFDSWHVSASANPSIRPHETGRSQVANSQGSASLAARPTSSANNSPRPVQEVFPPWSGPTAGPPLPPRRPVVQIPPTPTSRPAVLRRPATATPIASPRMNAPPQDAPATVSASANGRRAGLGLSIAETVPQPSSVPIGGRPLMHDGQVLIYPTGFSCSKCHNTGYKAYDPSHPCRKCWARYGRPFTGPLTLAPRSPSFQRPLPHAVRPPASPAAGLPGAWPESGPRGRFQGPGQSGFVFPDPAPSAGRGAAGQGSGVGQGQLARGRTVRYNVGRPPPGAMVVMPGDPRIGGQLCPGCGGEGVVSILFFDSETCPTCRGLGRINV